MAEIKVNPLSPSFRMLVRLNSSAFQTQDSLLLLAVSQGGIPGGSEVKASASNVGDPGSILGSGRYPGEGNGNPLLYSCLENPMDGGVW